MKTVEQIIAETDAEYERLAEEARKEWEATTAMMTAEEKQEHARKVILKCSARQIAAENSGLYPLGKQV